MLAEWVELVLMRLFDASAARAEMQRQNQEAMDAPPEPESPVPMVGALPVRWLRAFRRKPRRAKAAAQASALSSRPDRIQIGVTIPSQREALRTGRKAAPHPVFLDTATRLMHTWLIGRTGSGKTNILLQMLLADIAARRGVCLFDKEGDPFDRALLHLAARYRPEELGERLILLDLRQHAPYRTDHGPRAGSRRGGRLVPSVRLPRWMEAWRVSG